VINIDIYKLAKQLAYSFPSTTDEAVEIGNGEPGQKAQTVTTFGGLQRFLSSVDQFVQHFNYLAVL
jgi:hypothetical protein